MSDQTIPKEVQERINALPADPWDLVSDEDKAAWAEWAEKNRLRKARLSMETGIAHVG